MVDVVFGRFFALFGEVGVTTGGDHRVVTENLLYFEQVNARFDQMGGIAMAQAMRRNSFFKPICSVTWRNAC